MQSGADEVSAGLIHVAQVSESLGRLVEAHQDGFVAGLRISCAGIRADIADEINLAVEADAGIGNVVAAHGNSRRPHEQRRALGGEIEVEKQARLGVGAGAPGHRVSGMEISDIHVAADGISKEEDHLPVGLEGAALPIPQDIGASDRVTGGRLAARYRLPVNNLLRLSLPVAVADNLLDLYGRSWN